MDINNEFENIADSYGYDPNADLIHMKTGDGLEEHTVTRGEWEEDVRQLAAEIVATEHTIPPTLGKLRDTPTIYSSAVIEQAIGRVTRWMIHECTPLLLPIVQGGIRSAIISARVHNLLLTDPDVKPDEKNPSE